MGLTVEPFGLATKVTFTRLPYRRYGRLRKEEAFIIQQTLASLNIESTVSNRWTEPDQPSTFEEAFDQQSNFASQLSALKSSSGKKAPSGGGGYSR